MGIADWLAQNWFSLLSAGGIISGLWFTAASCRAETKARRIANLLTMTQNHRELWRDFYHQPQLARVLDASVDVALQPVTRDEEIFVIAVIQHLYGVFQAMRSDLTIKPEGVRQDARGFFSLPIPKAVWDNVKPLQDEDFTRFI